MTNNWLTCFPEGYTPRKQQVEALNFSIKNFEQKKFVILELPTGVGKSFIATTLGQYYYKNNLSWKTYILTTQIILQNQYNREFPSYANISSKNNYRCLTFPDTSCGEMKWLHDFGSVPRCGDCPYQQAKENFMTNHMSITNTAFFLSNLQYNENIIDNRELLVIDEAHNLQDQLIKYKGIELNFQKLHKEYGYKQKNWISQDDDHIFDWITNIFYIWLANKKTEYKENIQTGLGLLNLARSKLIDISKRYDYLDKLMCQLNRAIEVFSPERWVLQNDGKNKVVNAKPVYASDFSQEMMFRKAKKVLLMSGTILNKSTYCRNLGIPLEDCAFLSLDSPFSIQNRRIFLINSGSMSKRNINNTLPMLISNMRKILQLHKQDKGIIHVSSHYIANEIYKNLNLDRLVIVQGYNNRDEMLDYHYQNGNNTVLISPSLMQGIDLKDDLSRFQIIAKVPFPNLGSSYISIKKDLIQDWYAYQTAKTIVQAYGRSIRNQKDYAITYILDGDFIWFFKKNARLFPKYFKEAISHGKI